MLICTIALNVVVIALMTQTIMSNRARIEQQGYRMITEAKKAYAECHQHGMILALQLRQLPEDENEVRKGVETLYSENFAFAEENLCNAYEVFCALYLDGLISRKKFRRDYVFEVIGWVEKVPEYYSENSKLTNTIRVYNELKSTVGADYHESIYAENAGSGAGAAEGGEV